MITSQKDKGGDPYLIARLRRSQNTNAVPFTLTQLRGYGAGVCPHLFLLLTAYLYYT
jgi:hypothetical protein